VRKILSILCATAMLLYSSCTKENSPALVKTSFKITIKPSTAAIINSTWQQVIGGEALITFTPVNNDSLTISTNTDSLNLKNVAVYSKQLFAGTYNVALNTESKAVADTFIRFSSQVPNLAIKQDQAITFPATTNDGVITISKSLIDSTTVPTFIPAGASTALKLGKANGYYFIYVSDTVTGRIVFTELTSGYTYMKDITVSAMNQYDLMPVLNTTSITVHLHAFNPNANIKSNL
jgi:hypothetical protein